MKKIINHLLDSPNMSAPIIDVAAQCSLLEEQIVSLVKPHEAIFKISSDYIAYYPPFGIKDKKTLRQAIDNAFPTGIPHKCLNFCYEFCDSDFNEMLYDGSIYIHKFGKTDEKIIFNQYVECKLKIYELWYDALKA